MRALIKANGATLEFTGYEYARMIDGKVVETGDLDILRSRIGVIVFRATYVTEWVEAS